LQIIILKYKKMEKKVVLEDGGILFFVKIINMGIELGGR
jgi:hypothetical protein